eukprot:4208156-Amphidinium_carterae.1
MSSSQTQRTPLISSTLGRASQEATCSKTSRSEFAVQEIWCRSLYINDSLHDGLLHVLSKAVHSSLQSL